MNYTLSEEKLDRLTWKYFDHVLKDMYFDGNNFDDGDMLGWKVPGVKTNIFAYNITDEDTLDYWGAFFESGLLLFNLKWYDLKASLERYLKHKGFKFKVLL